MAPHTTYSLREQKAASVQRLGTGSGNQRFGQGHRLEINSVSLFLTVEETEAPQKTHAHAERAGKLRTERP